MWFLDLFNNVKYVKFTEVCKKAVLRDLSATQTPVWLLFFNGNNALIHYDNLTTRGVIAQRDQFEGSLRVVTNHGEALTVYHAVNGNVNDNSISNSENCHRAPVAIDDRVASITVLFNGSDESSRYTISLPDDGATHHDLLNIVSHREEFNFYMRYNTEQFAVRSTEWQTDIDRSVSQINTDRSARAIPFGNADTVYADPITRGEFAAYELAIRELAIAPCAEAAAAIEYDDSSSSDELEGVLWDYGTGALVSESEQALFCRAGNNHDASQ